MAEKWSRRSTLQAVGCTLTIGIAGCTANPAEDPSPTNNPTPTSSLTETPSATKTESPTPSPSPSCQETFDASKYVSDWHPEKVRGAADPIEVEETIDSDVAIEVKCGDAASDAVFDVHKKQLGDTMNLAWGFGEGGDTGFEEIVRVTRILTVSRECEVIQKPAVSFKSVRQATPRTVQATVHHEDTTYSCEHAVFVSDEVLFEL